MDIHTFYGKSHVLNGISIFINESEVVCLLGRNGAGKSTTFKSIIGLQPPTTGSIKFKGKEIISEEPYAIARLGIGYVPEDRRIFSDLTVKENLEVIPQRKKDKAIGWSLDKIYSLFPVLGNFCDRKGMELSGGQQQMLTIARTLMINPDLLLLDEPSEGLAPLIVKEMEKLILKIKFETTILLAEQNSRFAMTLSDRGFIIEKGKIWFEGSIAKLQENKEIREKYLAV